MKKLTHYESTRDDSQKAAHSIPPSRMSSRNGAMETESKFCTRSPGVRLKTATSNDLTDRTEGLFLTPTFSGL